MLNGASLFYFELLFCLWVGLASLRCSQLKSFPPGYNPLVFFGEINFVRIFHKYGLSISQEIYIREIRNRKLLV